MQQQISILDSQYGKKLPTQGAHTTEQISRPSSRRSSKRRDQKPLFLCLKGNGLLPEPSWATDSQSLGRCSTLSTQEFLNGGRESTLSQILEENVPTKYWVTARAAEGILRRASRRGKLLPGILEEALVEVIALSTTPEETATA